MKTERESSVQSRAMSIIRKYGGYVYKNAQNIYTERGRPDLAACIPVKISKLREIYGDDAEVGIFAGFEMKRDSSVYGASVAQTVVGGQIKNAKGIWMAIDDTDVIEGLMINFRGVL